MAHRFLIIAMTLIPLRGPVMKCTHKVGLALLQVCTQEISEQLVIPIPGMPIIQGDDEQVGLLQVRELRPAVLLSCQLLAEGSIQAIQQRSVQQKLLDLFWLLLKHFFREIVHNRVVTAREGREKARSIKLSLHRESCELQTSNPSLGTRFQHRDLVSSQMQPHDVVEKNGCFLARKTQISSADLNQLIADSQASQREG